MERLLQQARQKAESGDVKGALAKLGLADSYAEYDGIYFSARFYREPDWSAEVERRLTNLAGLGELAGQVAEQLDDRRAKKARRFASRAQQQYASIHERLDQERRRWGAEQSPGGYRFAVPGCDVLGGHGLAPRVGERWDLNFMEAELRLVQQVGARWERIFTEDELQPDPQDFRGKSATVAYEDITAIEIGGPGKTQSGGGFFGGGFGLQGAAEGMLVATALNMLTTRSKIDTVICLQTKTAELFLHSGDTAPDALRMRLSPVFTRLRQQHVASTSSEGAASDGPQRNIAERLAQLADLHARGALNDDEFSAAKAKLLEGK
jgi:hypothetical protein